RLRTEYRFVFPIELVERRSAYEGIEALLQIHPFVDSSMDDFEYEESSQSEEVPTMLYGQLIQANEDLAHSKQVARSPDSVRDFWLWRNVKVSNFTESDEEYVDVRNLDEDQLATFSLPEA
ncbi:7010_t:CDS:2, partial [Acaulospora colombiana]